MAKKENGNRQPDHLTQFIDKMEQSGVPPRARDMFSNYYQQLVSGRTGQIPESNIVPLQADDIPPAAGLERFAGKGRRALEKTAMIKLNGGLGTSMGLKGAKSLLPVTEGKSFLDIILMQAEARNVTPVLMNSFNTHGDTLKALDRIRPKKRPLLFVQNKFPKVLQADLSPATWPDDPHLEWNPAGHGDIYTALDTTGTLDRLLADGIEYAFISNADNLGAVVDDALLGYFVSKGLSFMMEVADRTPNDQKGGHLAWLPDGRWILREIAQCPEADLAHFTDIRRHRNFNTNNIWVHLGFLRDLMASGKSVALPFMANSKPLNPRDQNSPPVFQIETAMGHAISFFDRVGAVRVPRSRFFPVKKSSDLLLVRSDLLKLSRDGKLVAHPARKHRLPKVELDPQFYKTVDGFANRMAAIPSLAACRSLQVEGDVKFEPEVVLQGDVRIRNPHPSQMVIPRGTVLSG